MKVQAIICAAVLGTLGCASAASAQGYERRDGEAQRAAPSRGDDRRVESHRAGPQRADDRRGPDRSMGNRGEREREYSAQNWHNGDRVPPEYRDRQHVVENWRAHRLAAPPRGYEWVQVGADYVLISVGSGVIAQVAVIR